MKRLITAACALAIIVTVIVGGCAPRGLGALSVCLSDASTLTSGSTGIQTINVTAKNGSLVLSTQIDILAGQNSCTFQSVLAGIWSVEAAGNDSSGKTIYYDKVSAVVKKNLTTTASMTLKPVNGEYEMSVDLTGIDSSAVSSAEVWVYPLGEGSYTKKHIITGDLNKVHVVSATSIKPQSYEFQIRLFNSSGNNVYLSPWYSFDVLPASKTNVEAGLEFSSFDVSLSIQGIPFKPTIRSVFASINSSNKLEVIAQWTQLGASELEKALVYLRFFETDRFDLGYTYQPSTLTQDVSVTFVVDGSSYATSGRIWVKVVAVGKNGQRSIASDVRQFPSI